MKIGIRKIIQVGNTPGITIPKNVVEVMGLKIGDMLEVDIQKKENDDQATQPTTTE